MIVWKDLLLIRFQIFLVANQVCGIPWKYGSGQKNTIQFVISRISLAFSYIQLICQSWSQIKTELNDQDKNLWFDMWKKIKVCLKITYENVNAINS